ncbi:energy transducer TonB [Desulfoplanes formicivorans]|uniref:TonB C-terminal domain-containing protein n=1 Tax=Desulfoplanes formicivorans TaxID=1592317 RepID=A0A194ADW8_9BACT|nr:energy transducer TonB [Desulfoplanes formicivorans]GAU07395.1 hypothetical protein DPF_0073 [Desulfoplanes formicivorans]
MKLVYNLTFWCVLLAAAILVNIFICMVAPILSDNEVHQQHDLSSMPVLLTPPPPLPEQTKREIIKKPTPTPRKPVKTPTLSMQQPLQHKSRPKLTFKTPSFEMAMTNQISPGLEVAPPLPDASTDFTRSGPPQSATIGFELGELDTPPIPIRRVPPVYPFQARRKGITGKVTARFLVNMTGMVEKISIVTSEPKGVFDQAVKECIAKWRFKPGIYKGKPVATWMMIPISFKL